MNYVGIDLHRRFSQCYVYDDETAAECTERLANDKPIVEQFFRRYGPDCRIAVEATGNWYWLVDLLQDLDLAVLLANPLQTKVIAHARVKNDKVDARMLAHLLRADLLPTCWIPAQADRSMRDVLRIRLRLLVFRTQFKNVIRTILAKFNITLQHRQIWRGAGRDSLLEAISPREQDALRRLTLPAPYAETIQQCLRHIDLLSDQIDHWENIIAEKATLSADAQLLMTVPGLGKLSAFTILYETGPINRFPDAKHYTAYAGLVPKTKSSADKHYHGRLCKQANMYLKRIFIEIALHASRSHKTDHRFIQYYHRIIKRKGKGIARIALARKIAGIVYTMLKNKIDCQTVMIKNKMAG